ncbi:hypothetical protein Tco_0653404 [Tanacetum coccineum]|uniref:Uncharacterized protein n=1 Tax=Tanacetum coccineum TaxID=301880 RepID=A0ABQ4X0H5_9ASTR
MDITRDQQIALDDALVAPTTLTIVKRNPFYQLRPQVQRTNSSSGATATVHHHSIHFKMNNKKYIVNLEYFREMLQICPKLLDQQFEEPPFDEEILTFLRDLGHSGEIKVITDVNVNKLHQPWRSFVAVINKCLSGKSTGYDGLRISQAQILWGMYHKKNVDYAYLLWEDFVYQDPSIPRRNRVNWHFARDDPMFTTIKNLKNKSKSKEKQAGSDTTIKTKTPPTTKGKRLKTLGKEAKPAKKKQLAKTSKSKGLIVLSEVALTKAEQMKLATKRSLIQTHISHASGSGADEGTGGKPGVPDVPTYGSDDEQISWKSSDEENDDEVGMSDDDDDNDDDDDDADNQDDDDNDGDDFVHPKFSTHDEEERQDEEDKEEEGSDLRVQTPSHFESTDDETYDEVTQGDNVEGEELDEEETNEEEEVNELYRDVNVNLEGRDTEMTDALLANVQTTQVIEDTHVIITAVTPEVQQQSSSVSSGFISNMLNPNPDTGIDSILNLNTESTSLVDVPVTTNVEMPPSSVTTLPPPPIPLIQPLQQTHVPTPTIVPSTSLQNLPTFGSLFKFEDRVKALEDNFLEFKKTNLFAEVVSSIPGIVDTYLANKMNEAVKAAVQLQSDRLREEAQADNEDFINKIDEHMKKIVKEQVKVQVKEQVSKILPRIKKSVNEQLNAEVLTHSSNEPKTSHAIVANLSELELKKILIDKMENNKSIDISVQQNKSIDRSIQQKTLYKALVDAYETDKDILETYGDTVTFKRRRDDEDEDEEPSAGSNRGSKRRRAGKELESTSAPRRRTPTEEPIHADEDLEEPAHQEFDTGFTEDQPVDETTQHPDWFQKPTKPPTPDRDWNKTLPAKHGPVQPWISILARNEDPRESLNELMDTPLDFSAFMMN